MTSRKLQHPTIVKTLRSQIYMGTNVNIAYKTSPQTFYSMPGEFSVGTVLFGYLCRTLGRNTMDITYWYSSIMRSNAFCEALYVLSHNGFSRTALPRQLFNGLLWESLLVILGARYCFMWFAEVVIAFIIISCLASVGFDFFLNNLSLLARNKRLPLLVSSSIILSTATTTLVKTKFYRSHIYRP